MQQLNFPFKNSIYFSYVGHLFKFKYAARESKALSIFKGN